MHRFRSRVSVIILIFILLSVLPAFFLGEPNEEAWVAYSVLGVSIGMVLLMLFGMRYEVGEKYLFIKIGPFTYSKIDLRSIQKVERSYNPLSAPAASLKRLYVKAEASDALISPINEREFIRVLKARNPNVEVNIINKPDWWRFWNWDV